MSDAADKLKSAASSPAMGSMTLATYGPLLEALQDLLSGVCVHLNRYVQGNTVEPDEADKIKVIMVNLGACTATLATARRAVTTGVNAVRGKNTEHPHLQACPGNPVMTRARGAADAAADFGHQAASDRVHADWKHLHWTLNAVTAALDSVARGLWACTQQSKVHPDALPNSSLPWVKRASLTVHGAVDRIHPAATRAGELRQA
jgi:hypothetical protein